MQEEPEVQVQVQVQAAPRELRALRALRVWLLPGQERAEQQSWPAQAEQQAWPAQAEQQA
ncbi:hypothetical protein D9V32_09065 [Mycetocola tolaasinivorans]|uniref:Uncharacterized protein n=1 Tax=Mycetocola tolaasinivorans TaxID=76635 RepID=A0A3L7A5K5_9MICO|nr:hypothetical protein D9V32_09065 [Mycetocola tolaasinivorans]